MRRAWGDLTEGFARRELWLHLGWQDIKQKYRRSVLGPFWITIATGTTAIAMGLLYSKLFGLELSEHLPYVTLGFIGGFSSEFTGVDGEPVLEGKPCEQDEDGAFICPRKPHLWPGAEIRVNFLGTSFVRLFVGRQVGGRICVNGSCRDLPDFEGVRGELNLSF